MATEFKLPELGENIESADIINVLVKVGDVVEKEQSIIEIETDKATIEVPSNISGKITEVLVKQGDSVKVGQTIIKVDEGGRKSRRLRLRQKLNAEGRG
ncbi:MAG: biotin/lipoyl-containing protein [Ignavibacteriaceae bacterium]|nr:biotin/lipoyl-containing protein [Ignavibacteriaceae bacterium]